MTKKLICPKCKEEIEKVIEVTRVHHAFIWKTDAYNDVSVHESETGEDYETLYFECPKCYHQRETLEEFIVEEET